MPVQTRSRRSLFKNSQRRRTRDFFGIFAWFLPAQIKNNLVCVKDVETMKSPFTQLLLIGTKEGVQLDLFRLFETRDIHSIMNEWALKRNCFKDQIYIILKNHLDIHYKQEERKLISLPPERCSISGHEVNSSDRVDFSALNIWILRFDSIRLDRGKREEKEHTEIVLNEPL